MNVYVFVLLLLVIELCDLWLNYLLLFLCVCVVVFLCCCALSSRTSNRFDKAFSSFRLCVWFCLCFLCVCVVCVLLIVCIVCVCIFCGVMSVVDSVVNVVL